MTCLRSYGNKWKRGNLDSGNLVPGSYSKLHCYVPFKSAAYSLHCLSETPNVGNGTATDLSPGKRTAWRRQDSKLSLLFKDQASRKMVQMLCAK